MTAPIPDNVKKRYIPCPICKGSGGREETVPGLGCGPWYDCGGCGGGGSLDEYRKYQAFLEEKQLAESEVICGLCGHEANRHYPGYDGCGFDWRDSGHIRTCGCNQNREAVMTTNIHTLWVQP